MFESCSTLAHGKATTLLEQSVRIQTLIVVKCVWEFRVCTRLRLDPSSTECNVTMTEHYQRVDTEIAFALASTYGVITNTEISDTIALAYLAIVLQHAHLFMN